MFKKGLLVFIALLLTNSACFAFDKSKIAVKAERIQPSLVSGELDQKILNKYIPIKVTISNYDSEKIKLSKNIYYTLDDVKAHAIPTSDEILKKTKRHPLRRALLIGLPITIVTFGIGVYSIPAFIFQGIIANGHLEEKLNKNYLKVGYVFDNTERSGYVFIPKKDEKVSKLIFKNASCDNSAEMFDLEAQVND